MLGPSNTRSKRTRGTQRYTEVHRGINHQQDCKHLYWTLVLAGFENVEYQLTTVWFE